ncbi:MAG: carboxymuconolactone decarboxylase family protein [Phascolarctobacterium sp.]|nr:carboxymuconolactone decarboxylase family protein [Phascolarctobacterium sp.]
MRKILVYTSAAIISSLLIGCNLSFAEENPANIVASDVAKITAERANADKTAKRLFGKENPANVVGEKEMSQLMTKFIYGDIYTEVKTIDPAMRELLTIAVLTASNTTDDLEIYIKGALNAGATPSAIRETIYQCTPYIGFPRVKAALNKMQGAFKQAKVKLPLDVNGTVNDKTRFNNGLATQKEIFGAAIDNMYKNSSNDQQHININLSANCFGDYYTRQVLDLKEREMITFACVSTIGGADPQVKAHVNGNLLVGNTRQQLLDIITIALPYIGYPRTLNALAAINSVVPAK